MGVKELLNLPRVDVLAGCRPGSGATSRWRPTPPPCAAEGELIPGLLQTEQYARRVHAVAAHLIKPVDLDKLVAARMRRQARLTDDEAPLDFSTVCLRPPFDAPSAH